LDILNVQLVPDASCYMDGFTNIPNEIVGEIFLLCLPNPKFHRPDPHLAPILLTHICRSWRVFARQYGPLWSSIQIVRKIVRDGEINTELQKINDQLNLWANDGGVRPLDVDVSLQNVFWAATPSHISGAFTGTLEVNSPTCLCLNSNRIFTVLAADALATYPTFSPSNTRQTPSQTASLLIFRARMASRSTFHFLCGPGKVAYRQSRRQRIFRSEHPLVLTSTIPPHSCH